MAHPGRVAMILDVAPLTLYRGFAIVLCLLVTVIDGLDFVAIGVVAPQMRADLGLSAAQLGVILALTQIGAAIGAVTFGKAADRFGRKPLIVLSLLLIALFTWLTALATSYTALIYIRFLVGLALTGALPATLALTSELAPKRFKATVISLVVAGFPLGAAIGSLGGGALAAQAGWQAVFYVGALLPLLLALLIWYGLPESPRFLARTDHDGRRVARLMKRLVRKVDPGMLWEPLSKRLVPEEDRGSGQRSASFSALFDKGTSAPTLMLWAMLFCSGILSNVTLVWLPTIFDQEGLPPQHAVMVVGAINIGATIGMALAGGVLQTFGARLTVGTAYLVAAVATALLGQERLSSHAVIVGAGLGFFLGMTTSAGYALSALIYPPAIRSTGVGGGAAALRVGTIIAPIVIPAILSLALPMQWTFICVAIVPAMAALVASRFGSRTAHPSPRAV